MVIGVPCSLCVLVIFQKPRNVGETTKGVIESLSPIWGEDRVVQIWAYNQPFKQLLCFTNIVLSCNPRSQASPVCMKNSRVKPGDEANVDMSAGLSLGMRLMSAGLSLGMRLMSAGLSLGMRLMSPLSACTQVVWLFIHSNSNYKVM